MSHVRNTSIVFLFFVCLVCKSQVSQSVFYSDFLKANTKRKLELLANTNYQDIKDLYPFIKTALQDIKLKSTDEADIKRAGYIVQRMKADKELYFKNYAQGILILNECLLNHTQTIDDSLICLVKLKNALYKINYITKANEVNTLIENNLNRKSIGLKLEYGVSKSTIYNQLGFYRDAIAERRSEFSKQAPGDKSRESVVAFYNDLGVYYNKLRNSDSAEVNFKKAKYHLDKYFKLDTSKVSYYEFYNGLIDGNMGLSYYNSNRYLESIPLLKNDIYYSMKHKYYESAFNSYQLIVYCYMKIDKPLIANQYMDTVEIFYNKELLPRSQDLNYILLKAKYADYVSNHKAASQYYSSYIELHRKNDNSQLEKEKLNQGIIFNLEQKDNEISQNIKNISESNALIQLQRKLGIFMIILVIMLMVVLVILYIKRKNKINHSIELEKINKNLIEKSHLLEQSIKDKELLIKEIHHRVKNNLQIISSILNLQSGIANDSSLDHILKDIKHRINAIALTHQMLYQGGNLSHVSLNEYVNNLVQLIVQSISSPHIRVHKQIEATEKRLLIDNSIPFGLLLNEIITNCYKHAFPNNTPGTIEIILAQKKGKSVLTVKDDGAGLPKNYLSQETKSIGMELIQILSDQINANLEIKSHKGTSFILELND